MSKNNKSVGFRTKPEKKKEQLEDWDIYPTHLLIEDGTWIYESN